MSGVVVIQIFLVITLIFLMVLMVITVKDSYKYKKTTVSTKAKVISKRQEGNSAIKADKKEIKEKKYLIVFEDANGRQQEFSVLKDEYKKLNKGHKGELSFKGTEYVKFEKSV